MTQRGFLRRNTVNSSRGRSRFGSQAPARSKRSRRLGRLEALEPRFVLAAPTLLNLPDQVTVVAGAPLHIALNGFDPDGDALTFQATSNNPQLGTLIPEGNRSLQIEVQHTDPDNGFTGVMTIELFEDRVPLTTARIAELADQGFYDGVIFHRIIDGFMIQGGDPTGTGSGGTGIRFDDEFVAGLRHTSAGILSMANSGRDTNDSQFFITDVATPHLDFRHTVFGFLTTGDDVRKMVQTVPVGANDRPLHNVVMTSVTVFEDHQNGVLTLSAPIDATGTATVIVSVDDGNGGTDQKTIQVNIVPPVSNAPPFLLPVDDVHTTVGTPVTFQLQGFDVEGHPMHFDAAAFDPDAIQLTVDHTTGTVTLTPAPGTIGMQEIIVGVRAQAGGDFDTQVISVFVAPEAPTGIELLSDSVSTAEGLATGLNNSAGNTLEFRVTGVLQGAQVTLMAGDTVIGQATVPPAASGQAPSLTDVVITTNGTAPLADGLHAVRAVQAVDGAQSTPSVSLMLTVDTTAPVFTSAPVTSVNGGATYTYNAQTDEETDPNLLGVSYSLDTAPAGMTINEQTGVIQWPTTAADFGVHPVTVRATDAVGNSATQSFNLTVLNQAPVLDPIGDFQVDQGTLLTFTATATDPNGPEDQLTFVLAPGAPSGAEIDPVTGVFIWTPSAMQSGEFTMSVVVTDSGGLNHSRTFHVTVGQVDQPPVVEPIDDLQIEIGSTLELQVEASHPDPAQILTFQLSQAPQGATINAETGMITWTPESLGTAAFTVVVSGDNGLETSQSFNVNVVEVNLPPVLDPLVDREVDEGSELRFTVTASDPNTGDVLTFLLGPGAPAGMTINAQTGEIVWTPSEEQGPGVFNVTVIVRDAGGLEDSGAFQVTVHEVDHPPVIEPIADQLVAAGATLELDVIASDPDIPVTPITFSLIDPPEGASIDPVTGRFTFTAGEAAGPFDITVRATDSTGLFAEATFKIAINLPPVLEPITTQTIDEDVEFRLTVTADDPNQPGDTLTFSLAEGAPAGMTINAQTGEIVWTPSEAQGPGTFDVTVVVRDSGGLEDSTTFQIVVLEVNQPPQLEPIPDRQLILGEVLEFVAVAGDPDLPPNELEFRLIGETHGATIDPFTGEFRFEPTALTGATPLVFTVEVRDDGGLSAQQTFQVSVVEQLDRLPPLLAPIGSQQVDLGSEMIVQALAADLNDPPAQLIFALEQAPAGATIDPATGIIRWTPTADQLGQTHLFTVLVSDVNDPALAAQQSFTAEALATTFGPDFITEVTTLAARFDVAGTLRIDPEVLLRDLRSLAPGLEFLPVTPLPLDFEPEPPHFSEFRSVAGRFSFGPETRRGTLGPPVFIEDADAEEEDPPQGEDNPATVRGQDEPLEQRRASDGQAAQPDETDRQAQVPREALESAIDAAVMTIELPDAATANKSNRDEPSIDEPVLPGRHDRVPDEEPDDKAEQRKPSTTTRAAALVLPWAAHQLTRDERPGWTCRRPPWQR